MADNSDHRSPRGDEPAVEHEPTIAYEPATPTAEPQVSDLVAGAFRYALVIERGPRAGLTYVLGAGETTAGRSEDSDIFLGDVTVSRHHARFLVENERLTIEDLGSTNGTYVNMERHDHTELRPGDEVIIGKFHLIVVEGNA